MSTLERWRFACPRPPVGYIGRVRTDPTALLGLAAAACTTLAFIPQVLKTLRERDTQGISLGMYALFCTGVALWLVYGLLLGDLPLIVANTVTISLAGTVLFLKIKNG